MDIPKIIHQLWIGPKPRPSKFMDSWRDKHPEFEYILWNEQELARRRFPLRCINKINEIEEINGKADIIRWEILYHFGGVFLDADSICIEPLDSFVNSGKPFAGFENEKVRPGLVATGTMAFSKHHPLCLDAIEWILANEVSQRKSRQMAWQTVGPGLLTKMLQTGKFTDFIVFPSFYFLPEHPTGIKYEGHSKVYAFQEWGSTKKSYDTMNQIELSDKYKEPQTWVSVLVSSYNTNHQYVSECLESIVQQNGHFGIELVWINDGSNELATKLLERTLEIVKQKSRFIKIIYKK